LPCGDIVIEGLLWTPTRIPSPSGALELSILQYHYGDEDYDGDGGDESPYILIHT
jgi:hypothetical protein